MKTQQDLLTAIQRMHRQYEAGRMDRDILRGWVLGLPSYPQPHGGAIDSLKLWFSARQAEVTPEVRSRDLELLADVATMAAPLHDLRTTR